MSILNAVKDNAHLLMSKVNVNGSIYELKDIMARESIDSLVERVNDLAKLSFNVLVVTKSEFEALTASADTMGIIYLVGPDASVSAGDYEEWITWQNGDAYIWEQIGSTKLDLSNLGAMAYADKAEVTIPAHEISLTVPAHTPAGSVETTVSHTSTEVASAGKFTPAGTIDEITVSHVKSAKLAEDDVAGVQIGGTVAAPAINVTPAKATVKHIASLGVLPSMTPGNFTQGAYTPGSMTDGKVEVQKGTHTISHADSVPTYKVEDETLSFGIDASNVAESSFEAVTGVTYTAPVYTAGSMAESTYEAPVLNPGELPAYGNELEVVTGVEVSADAPAFTGKFYALELTNANDTIKPVFHGTEGDLAVKGNYDRANEVAASTFTGNEVAAQALAQTIPAATVEARPVAKA